MIFLSGLKNLNQNLTFFPIFMIDQNISEKKIKWLLLRIFMVLF